MTSQPLPSGFPYIRGKLFFSFFISVERTYLPDVLYLKKNKNMKITTLFHTLVLPVVLVQGWLRVLVILMAVFFTSNSKNWLDRNHDWKPFSY
jgi:hypothetical protein